MKKIVTIIFLIFLGIKLNAQAFHTHADTANYLIGQIGNKKNNYIGKPFSVLYDSLKVRPVYVIPNYGGMNLNNQEDFGKTLDFEFNFESDFSKAHFIIVYWNAPPYNIIYPMFYPKENRAPIGDIINLYKPLIIKDIVVKDYTQDDPVDPNVVHVKVFPPLVPIDSTPPIPTKE